MILALLAIANRIQNLNFVLLGCCPPRRNLSQCSPTAFAKPCVYINDAMANAGGLGGFLLDHWAFLYKYKS